MRSWMFCLIALLASPAFGQVICKDGKCQLANGVVIAPLQEEVFIDSSTLQAATTESDADRLNRIIRATVRVTVSGVCGSGTVVGRDGAGNAIVLTNAHVAGTQKGRIVQLERWEQDGTSEKGQGAVIASGYGRGMSVDFALLKCNTDFAKDVVPIPLADRFPKTDGGVTTFGCPRCEWPSMQVLKLNRAEGQILTWKPEAIGGRSGSSVIDYTEAGPRVVGLLTWGGGGEGLGQSTPFLLQAMRGRLPQPWRVFRREFAKFPVLHHHKPATLKQSLLKCRPWYPQTMKRWWMLSPKMASVENPRLRRNLIAT